MITLVTGGARSGKSTFAEKLASESGKKVVYIATAVAFDEEMKDRIRKHRESRPTNWSTIERYHDFASLGQNDQFKQAGCILLDCMGVMLNNLIFDSIANPDICSLQEIESLEQSMMKELSALFEAASGKTLILVTNEVGMGIVPENRLSRFYRDILGRANRLAAEKANHVYIAVSGIPVKIK